MSELVANEEFDQAGINGQLDKDVEYFFDAFDRNVDLGSARGERVIGDLRNLMKHDDDYNMYHNTKIKLIFDFSIPDEVSYFIFEEGVEDFHSFIGERLYYFYKIPSCFYRDRPWKERKKPWKVEERYVDGTIRRISLRFRVKYYI